MNNLISYYNYWLVANSNYKVEKKTSKLRDTDRLACWTDAEMYKLYATFHILVTRLVTCNLRGCTSGGVYVPYIYMHAM